MKKYNVISAVSISRTGAFFPAKTVITLDKELNQKEADFLIKAKAIEEIAEPKKPAPAKKAPAKKPAKKG